MAVRGGVLGLKWRLLEASEDLSGHAAASLPEVARAPQGGAGASGFREIDAGRSPADDENGLSDGHALLMKLGQARSCTDVLRKALLRIGLEVVVITCMTDKHTRFSPTKLRHSLVAGPH